MNTTGIRTYNIQPKDTLWNLAQQFNTSVYAIAALNPKIDINSLHVGQTIYIWPGFGDYPIEAIISETTNIDTPSKNDLSNLMRLLWEQHMYWTILAIKALVFDSPDTNEVIQRLLQNPNDFANALRMYYGKNIADRFSELLTNHLVIAAELVQASKANDKEKAADAEKRWYRNGEDIAVLLSSMNPFWDESEWKQMFFDHLGHVKKIAVDMLTKDYQAAVNDIEPYEKQGLMMADTMSSGIIRQFNHLFK